MKIKNLSSLFLIVVVLSLSVISISSLNVFATSDDDDDDDEITCNSRHGSMGEINHMGGTCYGEDGGIVNFGGSSRDSGDSDSFRFHGGFHQK